MVWNVLTQLKGYPGCTNFSRYYFSFCSETEEEHKDTLSLMDYVKFDYGFMFKYSERPN